MTEAGRYTAFATGDAENNHFDESCTEYQEYLTLFESIRSEVAAIELLLPSDQQTPEGCEELADVVVVGVGATEGVCLSLMCLHTHTPTHCLSLVLVVMI